jgi:preprotein translocase subunit Sec63
LAVRRVYLLFRRTAAKATLYDLHTTTTLQVLYQNLKSDRELRSSLFAGALISTLVWCCCCYLLVDRSWSAGDHDDDPYKVLGLTPPVYVRDVQRAYCRLSMVYRDEFINMYQYICRPGTRCPYYSSSCHMEA